METKWQGSKWIRQDRRLAIYLRDGMACCYCGSTVENDGVILSLDHITPRSQDGDNSDANLVTSCKKCNSSRGDRDIEVFCHAVAEYLNHNVKGDEIIAFIRETTARPIAAFRVEAKEIIGRRSSFSKAILEATKG